MDDPKLDEKIVDYYSDQRLSANSLEMLLDETRLAREKFHSDNANLSVNNRLLTQEKSEHSDLFLKDHPDKNSPDEIRSTDNSADNSVASQWWQRFVAFVLPFGSHVGRPDGGSGYSLRMIAASVCVFAVVGWVSMSSVFKSPEGGNNLAVQSTTDQNSLTQIMMREAALNHQTKLQVEYDDSDLVALAASMERLDFDLVLPERLAKGHTVLGGRYCTLAGNLAVHLRLQPHQGEQSDISNTGNVQTAGEIENRAVGTELSVFMTLATDDLLALSDLNHVFPDKVSVNSWQQGELFYLLAEGGQ